ncbi:TlpA family protein disulfide reductase [Marinitenerispora sediminis]|uniref:Thioredoxin n=1 Tax=Marinitenerispora sediminis TaxID=1931232 RepID=A0A368T729_9ACTN|nr:thioredoxin family protein [Marinitenerispora sediminis]RCV50855.1 thioredoxin [Marinitenerispora sediminis]RCV56492.1 thioredoxin [Marinitenerispora sediminis]RCV59575.1 thioredoxin [Marinitenerispora sediminis]
MAPEQVAGGAAAAAVLVLGTVLALVLRRRSGRFRAARSRGVVSAADEAAEGLRLTAEDIGAPLGERATLLQFSTAFCQPCRATRRVLAEAGALVPGVAHVEIDAESHLGLVRRLGILRTPTVLVLDARGAISTRASGQPRKADVIAALGRAVQ